MGKNGKSLNLRCQKSLKIDVFCKLSLKISSNQRFYVNWTSNLWISCQNVITTKLCQKSSLKFTKIDILTVIFCQNHYFAKFQFSKNCQIEHFDTRSSIFSFCFLSNPKKWSKTVDFLSKTLISRNFLMIFGQKLHKFLSVKRHFLKISPKPAKNLVKLLFSRKSYLWIRVFT